MADTFKVLAQSLPNVNVLTNAYTVPGSKQTTVSSLIICNQNSSEAKVRVSIAVNNEADTPKQYIYYDLPIAPNDTFIATVGITLGINDRIRVLANSPNVSFNFFGVEVL